MSSTRLRQRRRHQQLLRQQPGRMVPAQSTSVLRLLPARVPKLAPAILRPARAPCAALRLPSQTAAAVKNKAPTYPFLYQLILSYTTQVDGYPRISICKNPILAYVIARTAANKTSAVLIVSSCQCSPDAFKFAASLTTRSQPGSLRCRTLWCIDPNRNVHNLYFPVFPHIQEIPFKCLRKAYLVLSTLKVAKETHSLQELSIEF